MSEASSNPHIVILGAGAAGTLVGLQLSSLIKKIHGLKITLVDNKEFHEYTPSIINAILKPKPEDIHSKIKEICPRLEKMFSGTGVTIIKGKVKEVTSKEVLLEAKEPISFTHLILCTGSSYSAPFKTDFSIETVDQRYEEVMNIRTEIDRASKILCVGGGPVGVEMVGEIASCLSNKEIINVHSKESLLDKIPGNLGESAKLYLENPLGSHNKVEIILNEKAEQKTVDGKEVYVTSNSERILDCDYVFKSLGIKPNSQVMEANFSSALDSQGFVTVDEFFKVSGCENIYAIGDVSTVPEPKLFYTAHMQAMHLAKNLTSEFTNKNKITKYKGCRITCVVSLGPSHAVASMMDGAITLKGSCSKFIEGPHGSRLASTMKYMVEQVSLSERLASPMNSLLYYTSTK